MTGPWDQPGTLTGSVMGNVRKEMPPFEKAEKRAFTLFYPYGDDQGSFNLATTHELQSGNSA